MKSKYFYSTTVIVTTMYLVVNVVFAQTVDIVLFSKNFSVEQSYLGVIEGLKQSGYSVDKGLVLNVRNANADTDQLESIVKSFVAEKPNVIVAAASTTAAQAIYKETKNIPIVFSAVTDPVMAKLLTNLEAPEGNVTGVVYFVLAESQLKFVRELMPKLKKIGIIYTPVSTASVAAQLKFVRAGKAMGLEVIGGAASDLALIQMSVKYLIEQRKVDALYIPLSTKIMEHADEIIKEAVANKIPVFAADIDSVRKGAIAGISYNYMDVGILMGKMVGKVLNGEKISSLPVAMPEKPQPFVNLKAAEQFGVKIPETVLKTAEVVK